MTITSPECVTLNLLLMRPGDATIDPSWCVTWVNSPSGPSWSVAWWVHHRTSSNPRLWQSQIRHSSQLIFLLYSFWVGLSDPLGDPRLWPAFPLSRPYSLLTRCHGVMADMVSLSAKWTSSVCGRNGWPCSLREAMSADCGGMLTMWCVSALSVSSSTQAFMLSV